MSSNTALNVFARTVVKHGKIPFEVESQHKIEQRAFSKRFGELIDELRAEAQKNGVADMSLDEINAIIKETRQMKKEGKL